MECSNSVIGYNLLSDTFINLENFHCKYFHEDENEKDAHLENIIEWSPPTQ